MVLVFESVCATIVPKATCVLCKGERRAILSKMALPCCSLGLTRRLSDVEATWTILSGVSYG